MLLSIRKSLQELFVFTNGYSISQYSKEEEYEPAWSNDLIFSLEQERFKQLCAGYFEEKCYHAKFNTKPDSKYIDIWLFKESYSSSNPFGIIKCWETKAIPIESEDLCDFSSIVAENNIPLGILITAGKFSDSAFKGKDKRIRLIDGKRLLKLVKNLPEIRKQRLLQKITNTH